MAAVALASTAIKILFKKYLSKYLSDHLFTISPFRMVHEQSTQRLRMITAIGNFISPDIRYDHSYIGN